MLDFCNTLFLVIISDKIYSQFTDKCWCHCVWETSISQPRSLYLYFINNVSNLLHSELFWRQQERECLRLSEVVIDEPCTRFAEGRRRQKAAAQIDGSIDISKYRNKEHCMDTVKTALEVKWTTTIVCSIWRELTTDSDDVILTNKDNWLQKKITWTSD